MHARGARTRSTAAAAAFVLLAVACGGTNDAASDRVVASPTLAAPSSPGATPETTATPLPTRSRATVSRTPRPTPPPGSDLALADVELDRVATLSEPVAMAIRTGDDRFYVAEKGGRVKVVRGGNVGATVLDVSNEVTSGSEQGLLGLAFSPDGELLYVNFTNLTGDTVVREYAFSNGRAQVATARDVLEVDQPFGNHNGGHLAFGPDGHLYIGLGDGGSGGDPQDNAQDLSTLLGKMLRIDPTPFGLDSYQIPSDNPFTSNANARDEIWAYGLRNPWRYSFDLETDDLYIGDVGQNAWEEVDFQPASSRGGENYGWNRLEGTHSFKGSAPQRHTLPIYEYSHDGGNCSVTGGYVYRGAQIPDLFGAYVFADFCAGRLRAFLAEDGQALEHRFLGPRVSNLASFGQDAIGELYVLSLDGGLFRIDPA